jgi:hypothetical protein
MLAVRHALARTRVAAASALRPVRAPAPQPATSTPARHRARAPAPPPPAPRPCCRLVMPTAQAGRRRISGGASAPGGTIGGGNEPQNEPPPPPTQEADEKRSPIERALEFGETIYYTHVCVHVLYTYIHRHTHAGIRRDIILYTRVCVRARTHVHTHTHTQRVGRMCQRRNGLVGTLTTRHSLQHRHTHSPFGMLRHLTIHFTHTHTHTHTHTASRFDVPEERMHVSSSS